MEYEVFTGDDDERTFISTAEIHYIHVHFTDEEKEKIKSALYKLILFFPNFLALFWAAEKNRETFVLTTTSQPSGVRGDNEKLESYLRACKNHKQYVDAKTGTAIGLAARVFKRGDSEQTQNVHDYPEDQRPPPCDDGAIFDEKWGSFAVIVGLRKKRLGVLEIVTDTIKKSYDDEIHRLCIALEEAGLQCRDFTDLSDPTTIDNNKKKKVGNRKEERPCRTRNTNSKKIARYNCLSPFFGLTASEARKRLIEKNGFEKGVGETTFRSICHLVQISEWPGKNENRKRPTRAGGRAVSSGNNYQDDGTAADPIMAHDPDSTGVQCCVPQRPTVQEYCNEIGIQDALIDGPDATGRNPYVQADQTASETWSTANTWEMDFEVEDGQGSQMFNHDDNSIFWDSSWPPLCYGFDLS